MCSSVLNSINARSPIITVFTLGKEKPKPASLGAKAGGSPNPPKQPKDSVPWSGPPSPSGPSTHILSSFSKAPPYGWLYSVIPAGDRWEK